MNKKKLVVVHGMGQHDDESVASEVVEAFTTAFGFYDSLRGQSPIALVDVVPVSYNSFFDDYRKKLQERSGSLAERLAGIDPTVPFLSKAAQQINDVEAKLGQDSFFTTHWLDVVLYYLTLLSEPIRLKVAETIANAIAAVGGANVHVVGHSLGSAVLHDSLAKAYGPQNLLCANGAVLNLSPIEHRLGGVHMIANVSRLLETFVHVDASVVRPGPLGCASMFLEYRHKLDPIAKVRPFDPTNNGAWIPQDIFTSVYGLIEPSSVAQANVHALGHYLIAPMCHLPLFRMLFGFRPAKQEKEAGEKKYFDLTVQGKASALQAAFGDLRPTSEDSLQALLSTAKELKDLVQKFSEEF